jgi:FkbM family methyltransferase
MKRVPFHERMRKFVARPAHEKLKSLGLRLREFFPNMPVPLRLPYGGWHLIGNSHVDNALLTGDFESDEILFVRKYLKPGMNVMDIGAHHGLYTLLASKCVGLNGRVIAFEPSARERKQLRRNLRLNNCSNVEVEPYALGNKRATTEIYLVDGGEDGCNSLRAPIVKGTTRRVPVEVFTLDDIMAKNDRPAIDFIKLDVEGAEWDVLRGGTELLQNHPRPVLMVEVYDIRTEPWGYRAEEIVQFLAGLCFRWFELLNDGSVAPIAADRRIYDANLVAIPEERVDQVLRSLVANTGHTS